MVKNERIPQVIHSLQLQSMAVIHDFYRLKIRIPSYLIIMTPDSYTAEGSEENRDNLLCNIADCNTRNKSITNASSLFLEKKSTDIMGVNKHRLHSPVTFKRQV